MTHAIKDFFSIRKDVRSVRDLMLQSKLFDFSVMTLTGKKLFRIDHIL